MTDRAANRPVTGVRYVLELDRAALPATMYRGFAHLPDADLPLVVHIDARGVAEAKVAGELATELAHAAGLVKTAAALVKTAAKSAAVSGRHPPRKIVRWRG